MAKRRDRSSLTVSLFPFLSVLACVIGVLTLLLAAIAIGQVGGGSLAAARLAERSQQLLERIEALRGQLGEFEGRLAAHDQAKQSTQALHLRLAGLGLEQDIPLEELQGIVAASREAAGLESRHARLVQEADAAERAVSETRKEIAARQARLDTAPIRILPSGLGKEQRPYFVECAEDYIELHSSQSDFSYRVPREEIALRDDFKRFLRQVKSIHNGLVVFLVRPQGVASLHEASLLADQLGVRSARLPLPGAGNIDLGGMRREG